MHLSRVFACLFFFTTASCNRDAGPAQTIAFYLTRKFEEESGVTKHFIAPDCPSPCRFKEFMQYVAPQNANRQPPYGRLDWSKLTDDAIRNDVSAAIAALHNIKYTWTVRDGRMFPSRPAGKSFRQVSINIRLSLSISRAFRLNKGLPLSGGSFGLMVDYWQAAADLRRKNLADFIVGRFPNDFEKSFGKDIKTVLTEDPISRPPAAPYKQLDLAKALEEAKKIDGLNAADVEDFVNNYVDDYNLHKDGGGRNSCRRYRRDTGHDHVLQGVKIGGSRGRQRTKKG